MSKRHRQCFGIHSQTRYRSQRSQAGKYIGELKIGTNGYRDYL